MTDKRKETEEGNKDTKRQRKEDRINEIRKRNAAKFVNIKVPDLNTTRQFAQLNKTDTNKYTKCKKHALL